MIDDCPHSFEHLAGNVMRPTRRLRWATSAIELVGRPSHAAEEPKCEFDRLYEPLPHDFYQETTHPTELQLFFHTNLQDPG